MDEIDIKRKLDKGYCERSGFQLAAFRTPFGSLSPFHAVWVLLSFLKGRIAPQMLKKDWGEIFWTLWPTWLHYLPNMKKGAKKCEKKGYCEQPMK
jgi:hypothetical protein